jgi:hypothetical protein
MASEVPELAQELHASALSLVELLGDVLDLARYDSGRLEMQESEFGLAELLDEEHRRFAPLAREKGLSLSLKLPDPPLRLRADRIKLSRVIATSWATRSSHRQRRRNDRACRSGGGAAGTQQPVRTQQWRHDEEMRTGRGAAARGPSFACVTRIASRRATRNKFLSSSCSS